MLILALRVPQRPTRGACPAPIASTPRVALDHLHAALLCTSLAGSRDSGTASRRPNCRWRSSAIVSCTVLQLGRRKTLAELMEPGDYNYVTMQNAERYPRLPLADGGAARLKHGHQNFHCRIDARFYAAASRLSLADWNVPRLLLFFTRGHDCRSPRLHREGQVGAAKHSCRAVTPFR